MLILPEVDQSGFDDAGGWADHQIQVILTAQHMLCTQSYMAYKHPFTQCQSEN
jgi:hypothetical protein